MIRLLTLLACLAALCHAEDLLPRAAAGVVELHGQLAGERFWARLGNPDPAYAGNRVLELLYTPPAPAALGGAHLIDCPLILLDDRYRIVAWNGRDTLAKAVGRASGYQVTREVLRKTEDGKAETTDAQERQIAGALGWDERLAPLLTALAWRAGSRGEVPCHDLFAATSTATAVSWRDRQLVIAGRPHSITPDAQGRVLRIDDAAGTATLSVTAWTAAP